MRDTLLAVAVLAVSLPIRAQNLQCPELARTLKEYQIDSSSSSVLSSIFSQHCQADGSIKSSSAGLDLGVIVKAIPVNLSGAHSSAQQQMTQFCKTYSNQYQASSEYGGYKEKITSEALNTINQCLQLQATGLLITHQITNAESASFYMRKQATNNFEIRGVKTTGPVSCRGQMGKGTVKDFDETISGSITSVAFTCIRKGDDKGNEIRFPESTITVMTDQAIYSVFWPQGTRFTPQMADILNQRIEVLQSDLNKTNAALKPMLDATPVQVYRCPQGRTPGWNPGGPWGSYGCEGQISSASTCVNIEYPHHDRRQCEPIGSIRPY